MKNIINKLFLGSLTVALASCTADFDSMQIPINRAI